jgi:DNA ligase-1
MNFFHFSYYLQQLEEQDSRLEMTALLSKLFKELETDEIAMACYLMQGRLVPIFKSLEFEMSDKLTVKALARLMSDLSDNSNGLPSQNLFDQPDDSLHQKEIAQVYKQMGDLGLAAQSLVDRKTKFTHPETQFNSAPLTVVFQVLTEIALEEGTGSQERKINNLAKLFRQLDPTSVKYVVRIVLGKLRLGFSIMTMIDALSWARYGDKSDSAQLEQAYQKKADIGKLAQGYLQADSNETATKFLEGYELELGVPVLPALCQRLNTSQEIIEKMGKVIVEPKYDGLRAQLHFDLSGAQSTSLVFTRSLEDVTQMFPELEEIASHLTVSNCIFDAEAIAYDVRTGELLPFQQTITRRRKYNVSAQSEKIPIRFYLFDLLYVDGESLIDLPLLERKQRLQEIVKESQVAKVTDYIETSDPEEIQRYHHQQLAAGLEGAVIKQVNSKYRSGRKGWRWVKIKEEEGESGQLNDSLDCVVMGYYRGKGKRAKFGIGAFLIGVLADGGEVKTIAKIGTGLTDEQFGEFLQLVKEHEVSKAPPNYDVAKNLLPDVWLQPSLVVEVVADELTNSPLHTAGKALRFPRLERFRADKNWDQATTIEELEGIKRSG